MKRIILAVLALVLMAAIAMGDELHPKVLYLLNQGIEVTGTSITTIENDDWTISIIGRVELANKSDKPRQLMAATLYVAEYDELVRISTMDYRTQALEMLRTDLRCANDIASRQKEWYQRFGADEIRFPNRNDDIVEPGKSATAIFRITMQRTPPSSRQKDMILFIQEYSVPR